TATIVVAPADLQVSVIDGVAVLQSYTAHMIDSDGHDSDITASAAFSFSEPVYGTFAAADATIGGGGAGPVRVVATYDGLSGDTGLVVFVKQTIVGPSVAPGTPNNFDTATEDPTLAPALVYPSDHILVPPNLGQFDVHWHNNTANTDNVFEVKMANQYIDIRLYTTGLDQTNPTPFWTVLAPALWQPIASTKQQLALTLAGMDAAVKGTVAAQSVDVTNENAKGGIYYWTTSNGSAIYRYDVANPDMAPAPYFSPNPSGACVGCHALSRDGTKMAVTLDGAGGRGTVWDVGTGTAMFDYTTSPVYWNFAAFNASADKLFTIEGNGHMYLRATDSTLLSATEFPPMTAGNSITTPEVSPDNTKLVTVEFTGSDYSASTGSIVIWDFDNAANTLTNPKLLVANDGVNAVSNYYPSFSPDGQWIVFTRTNGYSYNNATAETWVVKADGTLPPTQLAITNETGALTNSWPRWVPFGQTFGATNEPIFYLTFSSQRPFGVRIPGGGRPQIWMTPFFPDRAAQGQDPSGNAFRVPFQDVNTANHIAQWTNAVVIQ
ncbi:MAG: hypothetical protein ABI678_17420, partial [Kofleriaceae bacterium]